MKFDNLMLIYHLPWGNKASEIVKRWFRNNFSASRNLVVDFEFERRFPSLKEIHINYPNIKTCSVVIHPYARALIKYEWAKSNNVNKSIKIDSFENFLYSLIDYKHENLFGTSQTNFMTYYKDNKLFQTDIVLRSEFIIDDFIKIQSFVNSYVPIVVRDNENCYPYEKFYNTRSKELVQTIFKEDFINFDYPF